MSAAAPIVAVPDERESTRRLRQLSAWMRSLGTCEMCALGMSIACVEQETTGVRYDWKAIRGSCWHSNRTVRGVRQPTCEEMVRAAWAERPRREPQKAAA